MNPPAQTQLFETETAAILKPSEKRKANPPPPPPMAFTLPRSQLEGQKTYRAFMSRSALERVRQQQAAEKDASAEEAANKVAPPPLEPLDLWTF